MSRNKKIRNEIFGIIMIVLSLIQTFVLVVSWVGYGREEITLLTCVVASLGALFTYIVTLNINRSGRWWEK